MESLESFSLSSVIFDVHQLAPLFYYDLGDARRHAVDDIMLTQNEIKSQVSLWVIANARSRQTKGV